MPIVPLFSQFRIFLGVCLKHGFPFFFCFSACLSNIGNIFFNLFGNIEIFFVLPTEVFLSKYNFLFTERFAVGRSFSLFIGSSVAYFCHYFYYRRPVCFCLSLFYCLIYGVNIVSVLNRNSLPAVRFKTLKNVFRK